MQDYSKIVGRLSGFLQSNCTDKIEDNSIVFYQNKKEMWRVATSDVYSVISIISDKADDGEELSPCEAVIAKSWR